MEKDRKEELIRIVCRDPLSGNEIKARQLIDEVVFLEEQLVDLKKMPFIQVHPRHPELQKPTHAYKMYRELLQQYNNTLRLLYKLSGDIYSDKEDESPLRAWVRSRKELQKDADTFPGGLDG
jgi:hypothetical protein